MNLIGLKDFRQNTDKISARVERGESFIVLKRSKPIFRVAPVEEDEGHWERIVDFTEDYPGGIPAGELLKLLREA